MSSFSAFFFRPPLKSWTLPHRLHLQPQHPQSQPLPPPQLPAPPDPNTTTQRRTPSLTSVPPTSSWTCLRSPHALVLAPSNPNLHLPPPLRTLPPLLRSSSNKRSCPPVVYLSRRCPPPHRGSRHRYSRCRAPPFHLDCSRWYTPRLLRPCRPNLEVEVQLLPQRHLHCRLKLFHRHGSRIQAHRSL